MAKSDPGSLIREAIKRTLTEPEWFCDNILHFPILDWQKEAIHAVLDCRRPRNKRKVNKHGLQRVTIRSCHGTGKTQFLAVLAHIWSFTTFGKIAVTAAKEAQLTHRFLPRYRKTMSNAEESYKSLINVLGREVKIGGDPDWGLVCETAVDPENLAGFHDSPQLFLVDEASAKRLDPLFPVIEGALTTPGSVVVEIGNPTRVEGEFYAHHCKAKVRDLYHRMHIRPEDAPSLISPQWVEAMRIKYGEDSPIFKIRVLGEFAAFDEYILIPLEFIEDMFSTVIEPDGSTPQLRISVDVADGGMDSTVITAAWHYESGVQIVLQKSYNVEVSKTPSVVTSAVASIISGHDLNKDEALVIVDALGVGAAIAGMLKEHGYSVIAYKGGEQSDRPDLWRNRRVQSYMALHDIMREGRIGVSPNAIDDEDELRAHLLSIRRAMRTDKVDDLEPKMMIRQQGLPSPDRADSLAMQFATQRPAYSRSTADAVIIDEAETAYGAW